MSSTLAELFVLYRSTGDRNTLGLVFDLTAPRVMGMASRLVANEADALDLVQATWLTAMQAAPTFDPSRELVPWLIGILVNHARKRAREERRAVPAGWFDVPEQPDPLEAAHLAEVSGAVARAIESLPAPYRDVVRLHLGKGLAPATIAQQLDRHPATVRTQIARGLRWLRKSLPRGLAIGALAAGTGGLAAVRRNVLERGPQLASPPAAASRLGLVGAWAALACLLSLFAWLWWPTATAATEIHPPASAGAADRPAPLPARDGIAATRTPAAGGTPEPDAPGTVTLRARWHDGEPAARISVRLNTPYVAGTSMLQRSFDHWLQAWTDDTGTATFTDVPAGAALVLFDDARNRSDVFLVRGGGRHEIDHVVQGHTRLEGRVEDEERRPIAGAEIWLSSTRCEGSPGYVAATTGPDGLFRTRATWHEWCLWVRAPGFQVSNLSLPKSRSDVFRHRYPLKRTPCTIAGRVLAHDGAPVGRAWVGVYPRFSADFTPPVLYTRTDATGAWSVDDVGRGAYVVAARAEGRGGVWRDVLVDSDRVAVPELRIGAGPTLEGGLTVPPGVLVEDLLVRVEVDVELRIAKINGLLTTYGAIEPNGTFSLTDLPAGPLVGKIAYTRGLRRSLATQRWQPQARERLTWHATFVKPAQIVGAVKDENDTPLPDLRVSVVPAGFDWANVEPLERSAVSDNSGAYEITGLPVMKYDLFVEERTRDGSPGMFPALWIQDVIPDDATLDLRLPSTSRPSAFISGSVVNATGRPMGDVVVRVWREGLSRKGGTRTDPETGAFRVGPLPPARYHLLLSTEGLAKIGMVDLGARDLGRGAALDLGRVMIQDPCVLEVSVRRSDDREPTVPTAEIVTESGDAVSPLDLRSADDGALILASEPLQPGTYRLRLRGADFMAHDEVVRVGPDHGRRREVVLAPAPCCELVITPASTVSPFSAVRLKVLDRTGRTVVTQDLVSGREQPLSARHGLAPGAYSAVARTPRGASGRRDFVVTGVAPVQVIELPLR